MLKREVRRSLGLDDEAIVVEYMSRLTRQTTRLLIRETVAPTPEAPRQIDGATSLRPEMGGGFPSEYWRPSHQQRCVEPPSPNGQHRVGKGAASFQ